VVDRMDVAESLRPELRGALSDSLVETLASIHAIALDAAGLSGLARHGQYAERQLRRWSAQWEAARTRDLPALDQLTELLRRSVPEQHETVLVHGDFHLRNLITAPESGRVRAVLDWELATLGDPLADLGSFLAYWPEQGDPPTRLFAASALPGFRSRDQLVTAYVEQTGRDGSAVAFWHVLGLWKVAIIVEGVVRRALNDPRNVGGDEALTPQMVDQLVDRAHATWTARHR
jgi:aminoglycoside phosphotransferase (APT) family kinase protein